MIHIIAVEDLTKNFLEYTNYIDVFSPDLLIELPKNTGIDKHSIGFIEDKQLLYGLIYCLSLVKLEILKFNIKICPKTGFI